MKARLEQKQEELLTIRANLGTWVLESPEARITVDIREDELGFKVTEYRKAYQPPFTYFLRSIREVQAKVVTLRQKGYKLDIMQFPELKEHFRNGLPITAADVFKDSILEIESVEDERTGLEFLLDNWK